ncbi:uncharacterized protein [Arachis hypogaea]|uniref:uncharacterized protein n=1 Tax=Arachis hypogaea TaxID=3818 RepID=UPI000DEC263B
MALHSSAPLGSAVNNAAVRREAYVWRRLLRPIKKVLCLAVTAFHGGLRRSAASASQWKILYWKSIFDREADSQALIVDSFFTSHKLGTSANGRVVSAIILDSKFWDDCFTACKLVGSLIKLLRLVDADDKPSLGYVYEGMLRIKDAIKKMFKQNKTAYQPYTDIINSRWDKHLKKDFHAAAYFLNPAFFFNENYKKAPAVMRGLLDLVTLYCKCNNLDSVETMKEIHLYRDRKESFDRPEAIRVASKLKLDEWWRLFGSSTPCLQRIVVRILRQISASFGCERNWSFFYHVHTKRRNRLEHDRGNDIVYVTYNLRLKSSGGGSSGLYAVSLDSFAQEGRNEGEDDPTEENLQQILANFCEF